MSLVITKENFQEIREKGIGNGFTVLNPADGFRKNNQLWFGTCSECGERVTNSAVMGWGWEHKIVLVDEILPSGTRHTSSRSVNYCPTVERKDNN